MALVRIVLADLCWRTVIVLMPFVLATLLGQCSLPRIVLGRLALRAASWLMLTGRRLAPEVTWD